MPTASTESAIRCSLLCVLVALTAGFGCAAPDLERGHSLSSEQAQATDPSAWVPNPQGWLTDLAGIFPDPRAERVAALLAAFEAETSHELAVLTVDNLGEEEIESFSLRVARSWGIGKADRANGALVVLAMQNRESRIEIADGLRTVIPNELAQAIMERDMIPAFREGRHADGIEAGLESLMNAARRLVITVDERPGR